MHFTVFTLVVTLMVHATPRVSSANSTNCTVYCVDADSKSEVTCGNGTMLYVMGCNDLQLLQVPSRFPSNYTGPIWLLDLGNNLIRTILENAFNNLSEIRQLNLSSNKISYIDAGAFIGLTELLYLNLTNNSLEWSKSFGKGVFKPLVNLTNLNVKENNITTFDGMGEEMKCMKKLYGLFIDACTNCTFGDGFENLTSLTNVSLSGRTCGACNMTVIKNSTFSHIPQVKRIWMSSCNIHTIEKGALAVFKALELLDISYNEQINFSGMNDALYGLRNSTSLGFLNVNHIHEPYGRGTELTYEQVVNLRTLNNLTVLHMCFNKLEVIDERVLYPYQLPQQLRVFTLKGNRMTYGKYVDYLKNANSVEVLDISYQHLNYDPFIHERHKPNIYSEHYELSTAGLFECNCSKPSNILCVTIFLPERINFLKWRKSFLYFTIYNTIICGPKKLEILDLSFNLITKWVGPVYGLESLKHLDLSENYCNSISDIFFSKFKALTHLNVSGNFLGQSLQLPDRNKVFQKLSNLKLLDLSNNKISNMPRDVFSGLKSLRYLNLSGNIIEDWNASMTSIRHLHLLDLSTNRLSTLPDSLMQYLDTLAAATYNNDNCITVNLADNPIECTCHTLSFLKRMYNSKIHFTFSSRDQCHLQGGKRRLLANESAVNEIIEILEEQCKDRSWITITCASLVSCVISVVVCICVYRNRWKLRYIYYKRNRRYRHDGFEWLFENDAFVSYAKNNGSFIKDKLVPALEGHHNLKVWVADRNSAAGASVAENITHAIYSSRKSILLVNRKYLKEGWCDYELNMALTESVETKRKLIIIVLMEDIPTTEFPITFLRLLKNETSIEYPDHPQDLETFWSSLADFVMSD